MLSEEFKELAFKKLEEMTVEDVESILISIGSTHKEEEIMEEENKEEKIKINTIYKLSQLISEMENFRIELKWKSKEEMAKLDGISKYCCMKTNRVEFGGWNQYECLRFQEEINPNKEVFPKIYRRMELVYEITKNIPDHVTMIEIENLSNHARYVCGEEFVKNIIERKDIIMKYNDSVREYEDAFKDVYNLSKEERDSLLSNVSERERKDTLMKTLYYIGNKNGKVIRSVAYEQIMDVHSALRNLINNESKGGPYSIHKIEVPFNEKLLYQVSVHRIRTNSEGRQYLEHMMYTDIIPGRDSVNSHIEELVKSKEDLQFVCDTRQINIVGIQREK